MRLTAKFDEVRRYIRITKPGEAWHSLRDNTPVPQCIAPRDSATARSMARVVEFQLLSDFLRSLCAMTGTFARAPPSWGTSLLVQR